MTALAEAVVPQPWSTYSMHVCIGLIVLGGLASLWIGLRQPKPTDFPEEDER